MIMLLALNTDDACHQNHGHIDDANNHEFGHNRDLPGIVISYYIILYHIHHAEVYHDRDIVFAVILIFVMMIVISMMMITILMI